MDAAERVDAEPFICGHMLQPGQLGNGAPPVAAPCRNQLFEIVVNRLAPTRTTITTHCPVCRAADTMPVLITEPRHYAEEIPALTQKGAPPTLLVCECGGYRFGMRDVGNEIYTFCGSCKQQERLGFEKVQTR